MLLCSEDGTIFTSTVFGCQRSHAADRSNRHDLKCERPGRASNKAAGHAHPSSCPPFRSTSAAAGWLTLVCGSEVRTAAASMRSCSEDHEVSLPTVESIDGLRLVRRMAQQSSPCGRRAAREAVKHAAKHLFALSLLYSAGWFVCRTGHL
mgnify:CR=1 FL=1